MPRNIDPNRLVCLYLLLIGAAGCSSGEVYAQVLPDGISQDEHLTIVRTLEESGLIERRCDWLVLTDAGRDSQQNVAAAILDRYVHERN